MISGLEVLRSNIEVTKAKARELHEEMLSLEFGTPEHREKATELLRLHKELKQYSTQYSEHTNTKCDRHSYPHTKLPLRVGMRNDIPSSPIKYYVSFPTVWRNKVSEGVWNECARMWQEGRTQQSIGDILGCSQRLAGKLGNNGHWGKWGRVYATSKYKKH